MRFWAENACVNAEHYNDKTYKGDNVAKAIRVVYYLTDSLSHTRNSEIQQYSPKWFSTISITLAAFNCGWTPGILYGNVKEFHRFGSIPKSIRPTQQAVISVSTASVVASVWFDYIFCWLIAFVSAHCVVYPPITAVYATLHLNRYNIYLYKRKRGNKENRQRQKIVKALTSTSISVNKIIQPYKQFK